MVQHSKEWASDIAIVKDLNMSLAHLNNNYDTPIKESQEMTTYYIASESSLKKSWIIRNTKNDMDTTVNGLQQESKEI